MTATLLRRRGHPGMTSCARPQRPKAGSLSVRKAPSSANHHETTNGHVSISTMHLAKDLEFRAVAVMACDDEILPSQARIEMVADDDDLEEVYNTERHLLYVACTRARDHLLETSVDPPSKFLDDLRQ